MKVGKGAKGLRMGHGHGERTWLSSPLEPQIARVAPLVTSQGKYQKINVYGCKYAARPLLVW